MAPVEAPVLHTYDAPTLAVKVLLAPEQIVLFPVMLAVGVFTVKVPLLTPAPEGVVTCIVPVVPLPTVAVICVAELTVKEVAAVPPILTAVAPVKFVPVMVTLDVKAQPEVGVKEVMAGLGNISALRNTETVLEP